jgi:putative solute:sodium symporter small subunit
MDNQEGRQAYWRSNLRIVLGLLSVWFLVSYGFSIILADVLDEVRLGGFGLGFWFAQQGSIYVFVILIVVYVRLMKALDRKHDLDDSDRNDASNDGDRS